VEGKSHRAGLLVEISGGGSDLRTNISPEESPANTVNEGECNRFSVTPRAAIKRIHRTRGEHERVVEPMEPGSTRSKLILLPALEKKQSGGEEKILIEMRRRLLGGRIGKECKT